jgi:hypothetical protein
MTKGVAGAALIAALVVAVGMTAPAFARGGGGGYGGGGYISDAGSYGNSGGYSGYPSGFNRGQRHGGSGGSYPPGWSHGQKRGWGGNGMPPGLYRRNYSNSYGY